MFACIANPLLLPLGLGAACLPGPDRPTASVWAVSTQAGKAGNPPPPRWGSGNFNGNGNVGNFNGNGNSGSFNGNGNRSNGNGNGSSRNGVGNGYGPFRDGPSR